MEATYSIHTFTSIVILFGLIHCLESYNHVVQRNKQYHVKVHLTSFHLNGHALGLRPQIGLQLSPLPPVQHNKQ